LYYRQFKYCLIVLSAEESSTLIGQYKLLKDDNAICCLVSPYNPKEVNAGWRFSFGKDCWVKSTGNRVATNASPLPLACLEKVSLLFVRESATFPSYPGTAPTVSRLRNKDFVAVPLPIPASLHGSVFVDPLLSSLWHKCPEHFVTLLDDLLKRWILFFIRKVIVVPENQPSFANTLEFESLFLNDLLSLNFPVLAILGVLNEKHLGFFIKKVGYAAIPAGRAKDPSFELSYVVEEVDLFVRLVESIMPEEHKKGCPFDNNRKKVITAVSCRIVFGLRHCWDLHSLSWLFFVLCPFKLHAFFLASVSFVGLLAK
jgi:hypothetical protein